MVTEDRVYDGDGQADEVSNAFADSDVIVSSRVRVARNVTSFPFVQACSPQQQSQIQQTLLEQFDLDQQLQELAIVNVGQLKLLDQQFVVQLARLSKHVPEGSQRSDETADSLAGGASGVSVTFNEQDHLRIQCTTDCLGLAAAWEAVDRLDDQIDQHVDYAFSKQLGYLTACPADVGTGLRASVLVHLPALAMTNQLSKVFRTLQQVDVTATGAFGDDAPGDFWRLGNRITLGVDEQSLIEQMTDVLPRVVGYERQARDFLVEQDLEDLSQQAQTACADLLAMDPPDLQTQFQETVLPLLSTIRLGVGLDLIDAKAKAEVATVFEALQFRRLLEDAIEREDYAAASKLRDRLSQLSRDTEESS